MSEPAALVLFRDDLRVADNGALAAAADTGEPKARQRAQAAYAPARSPA